MTHDPQPIEVDAFLASLRDRSADGVYDVAFHGAVLPVAVRLQDAPGLVFTFAGAVARNTKSLPRFATTRLDDYTNASVIGFSDPSLHEDDQLRLAWYAGHDGFALQQLLPELIQQIRDALKVNRVAFMGSSGGGFAALYYSWKLPGSFALVSNPQTNLDLYNPNHRNDYRAACWPAIDQNAPLATVIDADLCALYGQGCENAVIYLQESSDFHHLKWHCGPFLRCLPQRYATRMTLRVANWGERGHTPVNARIWLPWLNAGLSAPVLTNASIEETWTHANGHHTPTPKPLVRLDANARAASRDEQIAASLAYTAAGTLLSPKPNGSRA